MAIGEMMRARTQPARQRLPVGKNVDAAESVRIALLVVFRRTFLATRRDYIGRSVGVNAIVVAGAMYVEMNAASKLAR